MKTFQQFCEDAYQLNEFKVGNLLNNPLVKRVGGFALRGLGAADALNPKETLANRVTGALSAVKPFSPASYAPLVFTQGQSGSLVDKTARKIPGMTPNSQTDIGKKLGDKIINLVKR